MNYFSAAFRAACLGLFFGFSAAAAAPRLVSIEPAPGSAVGALTEIEVLFDGPVLGLDAFDLLANGTPALDVTESAPGQFVFSLPPLTSGTVSLAWSATHGIVSNDGFTDPFVANSWTVTFDPALARRQIVISEFMADSDVTLYDDDCDRSDWIEIQNTGTSAVDLGGWSLTDDASLPGKWRFPPHTLDAGAYLVVFASQKDKTNLPPRACRTRPNSLAGYHTNFRLDAGGEYLALVAPDGEVVSAFSPQYPPQQRDISYGRASGSLQNVGYLSRPTPRAANAATGAGFAPEIRFSRPSGPFLHPFLLSLSSPSTNAIIRFTSDGTFPAETNARLQTYSGPIPVTTTTQIRARAYQSGLLPGLPSSETYLRLTNDAAQLATLTSSLPIVVMTTLKAGNISASLNTPVHFSLFEPRNGITSLLTPPTLATRGGAKTRGSSTGGQPQSNFAIEWWDEFNQDVDHPILGMPEDSEWVLYAPNEFDAALIHNPFTMELSRQMNFPAPRTRFVEVYLNKGGSIRSNDWFGLYVLMEKPGLSQGRINAPKAAPEDLDYPEITGSYMFKTDRLDPGDTGFAAGGGSAFVEPKEREMKSPQRAPQLAFLTQYFRDLDAALRPTNPLLRDPVRGYRGYLELTNWIDFHVLELLSGQVDAIRLSTYFYKPRNAKVHYGPRWDYDRAWESKGDSRDDNPRVWDSGGGLFSGPWWNRVLGDRDAWQLWIDRWQSYRQSVFSRDNMFAVIDAMTNEIRSVQPRENRRWSSTAPRINYPNEIRIMKTWISNRLAWIDSQFAQPPRLSSSDALVQPGFLLSIEPPTSVSHPTNVSIFYTLDGTDPRPSRGTSAPVAILYSSPITITTNTRIIARTRDNGRNQRGGPPSSSTWSSPAIATFIVTPIPLLITEIQFHPQSETSLDPLGAPDIQFLEIKNTGSHVIDLTGCQFVRGISFRFTATNEVQQLGPGERCLLVSDAAGFANRHPGLGPVAGQFEGELSNAGERITLLGPVGETILDFSFTDDGFPAADGLGFSLVLKDESTPPIELGHPSRWRRSSRIGGSPGKPDPDPGLPIPEVRVSEVMAFSGTNDGDWVELYNPEDQPANVGGWWLSDSLNAPKRARLPSGWVIPPKGYLVVPSSLFDHDGTDAFAFGSGGDEVWLFSANDAGELTGWVHGFSFGPSTRGRSFGRFVPTGAARETFASLAQPSRGQPNALPAVGPLVVSEIASQSSHAATALGRHDAFIEILNASPNPVTLVDPQVPSDAWRLAGDIDFHFAEAFPLGAAISPGGRMVVVAFDPALDRHAVDAFRARYRLDPSVPILGPWQGSLPSTGFELQLLPPSAGNRFETDAPPVDSDAVHALPTPPWPISAFQPGTSLSRLNSGAFGNDGSLWRATPPTPGEADNDGDGLPDSWELAHGLDPNRAMNDHGANGDPDADGFPNAAEWRNNSNPKLPDDHARIDVIESGFAQVAVFFSAQAGSSWIIEAGAPSEPIAWQTVQTGVIPPDGTLVLPLATRPNSASVFRLRTP